MRLVERTVREKELKIEKRISSTVLAVIFNIERHALHDGPGIRTLVFIKGCPLHCSWCSNPEGINPGLQLMFLRNRCRQCGRCSLVCPVKAIYWEEGSMLCLDRALCTLCGRCVETCPEKAIDLVGKPMTAQEAFSEVVKDVAFYRSSGGGVTVSGGEPLCQSDFVDALFQLCKDCGIGTAVETSGAVPWDDFLKVITSTDLFLYDIKHMDPEKHRAGTGIDNIRILENLKRLDSMQTPLIIRVPVIPDFNDTEDNMKSMAGFLKNFRSLVGVQLLPYHALARSKYWGLDLEYKCEELDPPGPEHLRELLSVLVDAGLKASIEV
jgi:pyruvate formate lyase activating enzyme